MVSRSWREVEASSETPVGMVRSRSKGRMSSPRNDWRERRKRREIHCSVCSSRGSERESAANRRRRRKSKEDDVKNARRGFNQMAGNETMAGFGNFYVGDGGKSNVQ